MDEHLIPLAAADIGIDDVAAVAAVLESGRLALGPRVSRFETALAKVAGVEHAVAANSGTSALHLIVHCLSIGPGDEVITTPFSFVASTNCILFEGATPVFADIEPVTYCIDPERVQAAITPRTRAILAVDVFGHPADWNALEAIAREHELLLIDDSAEAIGSSRDGRPCGGFGNAGVFAFYPNKQITTGEGGAVVTNDADLAQRCRSMANQGRGDGGWLSHVRLGYNYRMDEMSAALGLSQLSRLDVLVASRARVAALYGRALAEIEDIVAPIVNPNVAMSWFVYVIRLTERYSRADRDRAINALQARGIGCRDYFQPIHLQPFIQEGLGTGRGDFPITESVSDRTIALPFFPQMTQDQVGRVAESLSEILKDL